MFELINLFSNVIATGLEALVIPALIAGGTVAVVGQIQAGRAAAAQGEAQAEIAARNALLAERQAEEERVAAAAEALRQEEITKKERGVRIAAQAVSGTEVGRGSNLATLVKEAVTAEADRLTILREGAIRVGTLKEQAGIFRAQGASAKARGRAKKRASILAAVGIGLSTAGQVGISSSLLRTGRGIPLRNQGIPRVFA